MSYNKTLWTDVYEKDGKYYTNQECTEEVTNLTPKLDSNNLNHIESGIEQSLSKDGGTMTGDLILNSDPITGMQASTKNYVDSNIILGFYKGDGLKSRTIDLGEPIDAIIIKRASTNNIDTTNAYHVYTINCIALKESRYACNYYNSFFTDYFYIDIVDSGFSLSCSSHASNFLNVKDSVYYYIAFKKAQFKNFNKGAI